MTGRGLISLITDRRQYAPGRMLPAIAAAAAAGVDVIQVRERDLDDRALLALVKDAVAVAGAQARVVVNDRCDVALAAGAAGVHLRADSMPASEVRRITPGHFLIGRSVHSVPEAQAAVADGGCDYLVFGTVFQTGSKPAGHAVAGLGGLAEVCRAVSDPDGPATMPVLAVGGVSERDVEAIARAGGAGIAAIGLFAEAKDMRRLVGALRRPFDTSSGVV